MVVIKETDKIILALPDRNLHWAQDPTLKIPGVQKRWAKTSEREELLRQMRKAEIEECQKKGKPIPPLSELVDEETLETRPYSGQYLKNILGE